MPRASRTFPRRGITFNTIVARYVGRVLTPALGAQLDADRARLLAAESEAERPRRNWDGRGEVARCERRIRG